MAFTILEDETTSDAPAASGFTVLDQPENVPAEPAGFTVVDEAAEQPPIGKVEAPEYVDQPGIGDDAANVGNAFLRGAQGLRKTTLATGVLNAELARQDSEKASVELSDFLSKFKKPDERTDPQGAAQWDADRLAIESKISQAQGDAAFRRQSVPDSISGIVAADKAQKSIPATGAVKEFQQGDHWLRALATNPVEVISSLIAESFPQMAPAMAATMVAGPGAGVAITGASSYGVEYANGILDSLSTQGMDASDPASVQAFFSDPAKVDQAREHAVKRGIPVAAFDAASAGLAGKILGPTLGKGLLRVGAASAGEIGMQATLGASGEAAGQLIAEGKINDPRAIVAEAVAEIGSAPSEIYGNLREDVRERAKKAPTGQGEKAHTGQTTPPALSSVPIPAPSAEQVIAEKLAESAPEIAASGNPVTAAALEQKAEELKAKAAETVEAAKPAPVETPSVSQRSSEETDMGNPTSAVPGYPVTTPAPETLEIHRSEYELLQDLKKPFGEEDASPFRETETTGETTNAEAPKEVLSAETVPDKPATPKIESDTEPVKSAERARLERELIDQETANMRAEQLADLEEHKKSGGHELLEAVRMVGGLPSLANDASFAGETRRLWETNKGHAMRLVSKSQKLSLDGVREALEQYGFNYDTPDALLHDLEIRLARGKEVYGFEPGERGTYYGSKTPKAPENAFIEKIQAAILKAPTQAELDMRGKAPGLIDFERPSGAGKISVQNTREALERLQDRYRPDVSGTHIQRIAEVVGEAALRTQGARVRVVRNEADLPAEVRAKLYPGAVHEGLADTDSGNVYILAGNISSPKRALEVFAHEVVGHFGIEKIVPAAEWAKLAAAIIKTAPKASEAIARNYASTTNLSKLTPDERATIAREYIAQLAEKPSMNPALWKRVVQTIRNALRQLGITRQWTEDDIRDLIRQASRAVEAPSETRIIGGGTRAAVRDLGKEVEEHSPFASQIETEFEKTIPNVDRRAAIDDYVKSKMAGEEDLLPLSASDKATAERFVQFFRDKSDFARRNGVSDAVESAYAARLEANPNLTLLERLAVYSSETNKAVAARTGGGAPEPAVVSPGAGGPTSIRNATVDAERAARGLPPAMEPARRSFGRVWDEAMDMIARDSTVQERLIDELEANPRALTDTEDALLLHRQVELQNEYDRTAREYLKAVDAGDITRADLANERRAALSEKLLQIYEVGKSAGTATGRGLNARKMMANEDFSLAKMIVEKRVANGGKPLTTEQQAEVETLYKRIGDLEKEVEANRAAREEAASEQAATDEIARMLKEAEERSTPSKKSGKSKADKVLDTLKTKADEARARIRKRRGQFNAGVDPTEVYDYAVVGAEYLAKGAISIGRFGAKLILEFGDAVRPHIPEIFRRSKEIAAQARSERDLPKERSSILEGMRERVADGDTIADLSSYVRKLALNVVRSGVVERNALLDAVHKDLETIQPGITRRESMDLISGYGDFKALDPEKAKATLRDLKGQMQQIGKLEDMAAGKAPRKTGIQRREQSFDEGKLVKEVNEAKKRGGFEVTDPATQLRSALAAKERALSNEIRAVAEELATGEKRKEGAPTPESDRTEALRAILDRLRQTRDVVFGKKLATDEQRLKAAIDAANRQTTEYERQVNEEDFSRKSGKSKLSSPEYEAAKARRDAARAERDEFKALDEAVRQQKENARTERLQDQISEIDRKLREGDTNPENKTAPLLTPAQQDLVAERDAMLRLLSEIRRNPKSDAEKQVERLAKQISELDRRLRTGDLETKAKGAAAPLSAEAADLMMQRDAMTRAVQEARDAAKPKLSPAEIALKRWKSATLRRIAELTDRTARGDFAPKPPRMPMALDAEGTKLAFDLEKAKETFITGKFEDMLRQRSLPKKILGTVGEVVNTARGVMTAFDLSAVLRQGGFIVLARPVRALRAFPAMFKAMASERGEFAVNEEIANRPNADMYRQAKLDLTQKGTSLAKMEEAFMSRWAEKIPGVGASGRAYRTFLNRLRADSFDAMAASLSKSHKPTLKEAQAVAKFINVATGRGHLGSTAATAAVGLNHVFFAPRLVLSRFQLLVGHPLWGGSASTRALVAGEYARFLVGVGVVLALAKAAGADDIEDDPRSSNFGKLRFGNVRLDLFSGLIQSSVLASRVLSGETKSGSGKIIPLRIGEGQKRKFGQDDTTSVVGRFLRTKLSPLAGAGFDIASGTNVVGERVTLGQTAARLAVPLTFGDVYNAAKDQGMPAGVAFALLAIFGAGVQTYDDKKKR